MRSTIKYNNPGRCFWRDGGCGAVRSWTDGRMIDLLGEAISVPCFWAAPALHKSSWLYFHGLTSGASMTRAEKPVQPSFNPFSHGCPVRFRIEEFCHASCMVELSTSGCITHIHLQVTHQHSSSDIRGRTVSEWTFDQLESKGIELLFYWNETLIYVFYFFYCNESFNTQYNLRNSVFKIEWDARRTCKPLEAGEKKLQSSPASDKGNTGADPAHSFCSRTYLFSVRRRRLKKQQTMRGKTLSASS